ncbi:MAG: hypothetical protein JXQ90_03910 [Cyclobacteriaceae bacterium]
MITITSASMDELNSAYKKLKAHYKAVDAIKLDTDLCTYKLELTKKELPAAVKNLVDKMVDLCDELHDLPSLNKEVLNQLIEDCAPKYVFVRQLNDLWTGMRIGEKSQVVEYISEEADIDVLENSTEEVDV